MDVTEQTTGRRGGSGGENTRIKYEVGESWYLMGVEKEEKGYRERGNGGQAGRRNSSSGGFEFFHMY